VNAQPLVGFLGHAASALAWLVLLVLLTVRGRGRGIGRWLLLAVVVEIVWAATMAASIAPAPPPRAVVLGAEAVRPLAWAGFLLAMLWDRAPRPAVRIGIAIVVAIATVHLATAWLAVVPQQRYGPALLAAVIGLLCVEQVYRNTPDNRRWAIKYLCLALAALAVFDLALYADALLFGQLDSGWWAARGFAHAMVVPLVAVSAARMPDWRLDVQVSRRVVFHTATLLASGGFLLAVAAIGYGLRLFGGAWGAVAQVLAIFAGLVAILALVASGTLRASLRVQLAKHFFSYRYDYRAEWLRLTELLARPDAADGPDATLSMRALRGLAALVESPGGTIWLRTEDGHWSAHARLAAPERGSIDAADPLVRFLTDRRWIVELPEWRARPERYGGLVLPPWLATDDDAWLVVPLMLDAQLVGFVELRRPLAPAPLDWEVRDILKTSGRQIAGTLAVREAVEKLVQARQFESFNRMSAYVVHDLKNLVAQLSLLLRNAARHRDNPEFQRDMLGTVENVLDRMQGLLLQLRVGARPIEPPSPTRLGEALRTTVDAKKGQRVEPTLEIAADIEHAEVVAHRDRLERVVGHLVQNAIDATAAGGSVRVVADRVGREAVVRVVDTGRGMSRAFIETRLFRPFTSTKDHGMGIGAFESREYLREIGASLAVESAEGQGSSFTIRMPLQAERDATRSDR
jgi:putative PEP-CTERM system histidine kinase